MLLPQLYCDVNPLACANSTEICPAKRLRQPTIEQTLADKKATDISVAQFFYGCGLPLHLVRQV